MSTPPRDLRDAVGTLLRADPARTLAVARTLRAPGRSFESTVAGASMRPALEAGARVRVALDGRARYEVGDIVLYVTRHEIIVHRVAHRGEAAAARGYVITRGDATLVPDPPVEHDRILGAVTGVWADGRWEPPSAPPGRSLHARVVRALSLAITLAALYLSPRATARGLVWLHWATGVTWRAVTRARMRLAAML